MIDIDKFASRHIGPRNEDITEMLKVVGSKSLDDLIEKTVPDHIIFKDNTNDRIFICDKRKFPKDCPDCNIDQQIQCVSLAGSCTGTPMP